MVLFTTDGRYVFDGMNIADDGTRVRRGTMFLEDGTRLYYLIDHTIPTYALTSNLQDKAIQNERVSFTLNLECINNADRGNELKVSLIIPAGFTIVSAIPNQGSYNISTDLWTLYLDDQEAELNLVLEAGSTGSQTITATLQSPYESTDFVCDVSASDTASIAYHDADLADYPVTLANLQDGKHYTVISYSKVTEASIHDGIKNNRLSVVNGVETFGSRATVINTIEKQIVTFVYDETQPVLIRRYEQYESVDSTTDNEWLGLCINEGYNTVYSESTNLLSTPTALFDDTSSTELVLPGGQESGEYIYKFGVVEAPSSLDAFFTGLIIELNSFVVSSGVQLWFESGTKKSMVKSIYASQTGEISVGNIAEMYEEWGINNSDLTGSSLEVHLIISNPILTSQSYLFSNLNLILYWLDDTTNNSKGFSIEGVHSRNYQIFMKSPSNPLSVKPNLTSLKVSKTDGTLITNMDMDSTSQEIEFVIEGDTIEDVYRKYRQIVRWMTNDRTQSKKPILKNLIYDAIPDLNYPYVLSDQISVTEDVTSLTCKAKITVPGGVGVSIDPVTTGAIGTNPGNIEVYPLIVIKASGASQIVITENVNGDSITLDSVVAANTLLYFDCSLMTVTDDLDTDLTLELAFDSVFPLIINKEYNFSVDGGEFQYITYYPGY